jgi:hypothetical protein
MAKRKKKQTRADKEVEAKSAKREAKLAEKETTARKPAEVKPKSKPKPKPKTKPKAKSSAKPKVKSNTPSVIETPLEQTDKPEGISKEVDTEKSDTETITDGLEATQADVVAEEISEAAVTENLGGKAVSIQTQDEQTSFAFESEDSDTAKSQGQEVEGIHADTLTDDVPGPAVEAPEAPDATETATEKEDDSHMGVESTDTEILADDLEAPPVDDQAVDKTEAVSEEVVEAVGPDGEVESIQTDVVVEAEDSDIAEDLSQDVEETQTDELTDDVSGAIAEDIIDAGNPTEEIDNYQIDNQDGDPTEIDVGSSDTEIPVDGVETPPIDDQAGDITEAILEAAAETERLEEEEVKGPQTEDIEAVAAAEKLADEVEGLQAEDEQTGTIVESEDSDDAESISQEVAETLTDELTGDMSESVDDENQTEEIDDSKTDDQPGEVDEGPDTDPDTVDSSVEKADDTPTDNQVGEATKSIAEEIVVEDSSESKSIVARIKKLLSSESKTVVVRIKKFLSGRFRIGRKSDDSTEEETENHVGTGGLTEEADDEQEEEVVEAFSETPEPIEGVTEEVDDTLIDERVDVADEEVVESTEANTNSTEIVDDIRTDKQVVSQEETNVEDEDEIQTAAFSENKPHRTKKTGRIISVFIVIAAVILLLVASVERRSAKEDLVQVSKLAESIKQMRGETLKDREQVIHSQIEGRELVIDALSLTRNSLELERANSDEVEVKRIIGVFISDIDERITKIKDNIMLLKNKLKESD